MKILFLVPYPLQEAPSQRFRFEQYFTFLEKNGRHWTVKTFLTSQNGKTFYKSGNHLAKLRTLLTGFFDRWLTLWKVPQYEYVFIHRETAPIGPPFLEWVIAQVLKKKIIYDFDDAIWLSDKTDECSLEKMIRWRSKVASICKWSYKISCGNDYLANYASQLNNRVIVNPTTIDMVKVNLETTKIDFKKKENEVVIGWTGSHSTLKYLKQLESVLLQLEKNYPYVKVLIIADQEPSLTLERLQFVKWNKDTEIQDLLPISIGIMPLPDDYWTKGKCGFKALQYMSLGIPTVASPVGVNAKIIQHGQNGLLAETHEEWFSTLQRLILDRDERSRLGQAGKKTVEESYSVSSNESNFLSLFS